MTRDVIQGADGDFVIPLERFVCSDVGHFPNQVIVRREGSEETARISGKGLDDVIPGLVQLKARIVRAVATTDSTLRIDFDGADSVEVPADPDVEAWEIRGPGPVTVIGLPGGGEPLIFLTERRDT